MPRIPVDCGQKQCEACGCMFTRRYYGSRIEDIGAFCRRRYCSRKCMSDGMVRGEGRREGATRHQARKLKGAGICETCGAPGAHVHHKDCNPANNAPDNLIRLCVPCHRKSHRKAATCTFCGSASGRIVLGFCLKHYMRFRKWGNPALVKRNQNTMLEVVAD
jgi:hypothetical protein